jgi:hypothetical protein
MGAPPELWEGISVSTGSVSDESINSDGSWERRRPHFPGGPRIDPFWWQGDGSFSP